jgi:hypothetical protein
MTFTDKEQKEHRSASPTSAAENVERRTAFQKR